MPFYVGKFSRPLQQSKILHLHTSEDTEFLKHGDHVEKWDNIFEWDEHCITASKLNAWRAKGDPLCDKALEEVFSNSLSDVPVVGHGVFQLVLERAAEDPLSHAASFISEVSKIPPDNLTASPEDLSLAQRFYLKHSVAIMKSLLHYALVAGFADPSISRVLRSVSYLVDNNQKGLEPTQASKDRIYSRLNETFQFVLDVMGGTQSDSSGHLLPGGEGWKAILRVRLLHGVARRRALKKFKDSQGSNRVDDILINQEDLAATLGAFCGVPLFCLPRCYPIPIRGISSPEETAFVALWQRVGFYLGIDPSILANHFSSPEVATKFIVSIICHIFPGSPSSPNPLTFAILKAAANRPPLPRSFEYNSALSRRLLGKTLSAYLGLSPAISFSTKLQIMFDNFVMQLPVLFGQIYLRKGWNEQHLSLTKIGLEQFVHSQLGQRQRRTSLRPCDRNESREIDDKVLQLERTERDAEGRRRLLKGLRLLLVEMIVVTCATLLFGFGIPYFIVRRMMPFLCNAGLSIRW